MTTVKQLEEKLDTYVQCAIGKGFKIEHGHFWAADSKSCCPLGAVAVCETEYNLSTDGGYMDFFSSTRTDDALISTKDILDITLQQFQAFLDGFDNHFSIRSLFAGDVRPFFDLGVKLREKYDPTS